MQQRTLDPSEEEFKVRNTLSDFTLSLIKAMLRSGYYSPGHPGSKGAKEGLYVGFRTALGDNPELTYIKKTTREEVDVLLDGVFEFPISISEIMMVGTAQMFIPKFIEYFIKKNLASFTLKQGITLREFEKFIEIMSEPPAIHGQEEEAKTLTIELLENDIFNVSTIFDIELVGVKRKLPWRVEIALTRLKKDLSLLPLFEKRDYKELHIAKQRVISDIIRPLNEPGFLKDILVNCDIISMEIKDSVDLNIEDYVVEFIDQRNIVPTVKELAAEFERSQALTKAVEEFKGAQTVLNRTTWILKKISTRLVKETIPEGLDLLLSLHSKDILTFDELSEEVKKAVMTKRIAEAFLIKENERVRELDLIRAKEIYIRYIDQINRIAPELLRMKGFSAMHSLVHSLAKHTSQESHPFPDRPRIADHALKALARNDILSALKEGYENEGKDLREKIADIFVIIGGPSILYLLDILLTSEDMGVRKGAYNILVDIGGEAEDLLIAELKKKDRPWYYYRNVIMLLGDMKSKAGADAISEFGFHEDPRIREEVIHSIFKIFGHQAEGIFVEALKDSDVKVKKRAISCLGSIRTRNPLAISGFIKMVAKKNLDQEEEDETIQIQACISLAQIGNLRLKGGITIEDVLIEAFTPEHKGILGFGKSIKREKPLPVRISLCEALGAIGGDKSIRALKPFLKDSDEALREKVKEALEKISKRIR